MHTWILGRRIGGLVVMAAAVGVSVSCATTDASAPDDQAGSPPSATADEQGTSAPQVAPLGGTYKGRLSTQTDVTGGIEGFTGNGQLTFTLAFAAGADVGHLIATPANGATVFIDMEVAVARDDATLVVSHDAFELQEIGCAARDLALTMTAEPDANRLVVVEGGFYFDCGDFGEGEAWLALSRSLVRTSPDVA